jgi:large subunit ribosomal protein L22
MQVRAIAKSVKMSPRKVRLIADAIRSLTIEEALLVLDATQKRASAPIAKTLLSAVANAVANNNLDKDNLMIESVMVNEGQAMKRFHPSSRGRVHPYKKKSSHITIVLKEKPVKKASVANAGVEKDADAENANETAFVKKPAAKGGKK